MSDSIFVDVQGTKVEGRLVHRSRADIVVEIVSPYGGMTDARHIPYFAMGDPANDFRGPLGDARAASLLTGLYLLARFVEENQARLKSRVGEMDGAIAKLDLEQFLPESKFREIRRNLRTQRRDGLLDGKSCQRLLVRARKKVEACQREIWHLEERFFTANFPMVVPVGTRDEVLAALRSPA